MSAPQDDPVIRQFREQISDNDRAIVDAVNRRLNLVAQVKAYKESKGLGFLDPSARSGCCSTSAAPTAARSRPEACVSSTG